MSSRAHPAAVEQTGAPAPQIEGLAFNTAGHAMHVSVHFDRQVAKVYEPKFTPYTKAVDKARSEGAESYRASLEPTEIERGGQELGMDRFLVVGLSRGNSTADSRQSFTGKARSTFWDATTGEHHESGLIVACGGQDRGGRNEKPEVLVSKSIFYPVLSCASSQRTHWVDRREQCRLQNSSSTRSVGDA